MAVEQTLQDQIVTFEVKDESKEGQCKSPCRTGEVSSVEGQELTLHISSDKGIAEEKPAEKQERTQRKSPRRRAAEENSSAGDSTTKRRKIVTQFKKIAPAPPQRMLVFIPANAPNDKVPPPVVETVSPARQGIQELYGRLLAERLYSLENLELQRNARLGIEEIISKYEELDNDS